MQRRPSSGELDCRAWYNEVRAMRLLDAMHPRGHEVLLTLIR